MVRVGRLLRRPIKARLLASQKPRLAWKGRPWIPTAERTLARQATASRAGQVRRRLSSKAARYNPLGGHTKTRTWLLVFQERKCPSSAPAK